MKNLFVLAFLIFISKFYLIAQKDIKFSTSASETISFDFPKTGNTYLGTNIQFGILYKQLKTSLLYQFGGLYSYNWKNLYAYDIHMLGFGNELRILKNTKLSPTIGIVFATQIYSNYKNGILNDSYRPYTGNNPDYMYSSFLSTKFLANLILGYEFELFQNTSIGLGAGIGVRDIEIQLKSEKVKNSWFITFDSQIKLSYSFQKE